MVRGTARERGFNAPESQLSKIQFVHENIANAHGICVRHVVVKRFGKEKALRTIIALNEPFQLAHPPPLSDE
jgi:hypothetical protein